MQDACPTCKKTTFAALAACFLLQAAIVAVVVALWFTP